MLINKLKKLTFIIISAALPVVVSAGMVTARAATENDLRYCMGMERLSAKNIQERIDAETYRLSMEKGYNRIIAFIKEAGLETDVTSDDVKKSRKAYDRTLELFSTGKNAGEVIKAFNTYNDYVSEAGGQISYDDDDEDLKEADTESIKRRISEFKDLKAIASDKKDIGAVSNLLPFVTEKGIEAKHISRDSTTFRSVKGEKIYCAFNGIILETENDSVTVSSGRTIKVTYKGLRPDRSLSSGDKVTQGSVLGRAKGKRLRVTMQLTGEHKNILYAYGKSGHTAYDNYMSENPWDKPVLDFTGVQETEKYTAGKKKKKKEGATVTENGEKKEVEIETPEKYRNRDPKLFEGDPFRDSDVTTK